VHDIADLERRGIPSVFVASELFTEPAQIQGEAIGFHPAAHYVSHPIQDRTDAEMAEIADGAIDALLSKLTSS